MNGERGGVMWWGWIIVSIGGRMGDEMEGRVGGLETNCYAYVNQVKQSIDSCHTSSPRSLPLNSTLSCSIKTSRSTQ